MFQTVVKWFTFKAKFDPLQKFMFPEHLCAVLKQAIEVSAVYKCMLEAVAIIQ